MNSVEGKVRGAINRLIVADGFAPSAARLAGELGIDEATVVDCLHRLADNRGLVLHPGSDRIWVAHPFSLSPTPFWVRTASGAWWGNCAWCSLGIAAMLREDAVIGTRLGGESEPVEITVSGGSVEPGHLLTHFTVPAARWWENVLYTCGTILLFDSDAAIDSWCDRHGVTRGETISVSKLWELAQAWYGNYLEPDWQRHSLADGQAILNRLGLTGDFWNLRDDGDEAKD